MLGVLEVVAAARVPAGPLVAMGGDAAVVLQQAREVHQVPRHERGVPVGEVVVATAAGVVEVRGARAGLADPAGVGLRRDRVPEVLQRVEDVHRAVLDAVLVPGDQAPADPPVVGVLARLVELAGVPVEALDHARAHRRLLPQPDGGEEHEDVGGHHLLEDLGPVVLRPPVLLHVRPHAGGDVLVDGPDQVDGHAVAPHDLHRDLPQALRVGHLGGALEGAADEEGAQVAEVGGVLVAQLGLLLGELGHGDLLARVRIERYRQQVQDRDAFVASGMETGEVQAYERLDEALTQWTSALEVRLGGGIGREEALDAQLGERDVQRGAEGGQRAEHRELLAPRGLEQHRHEEQRGRVGDDRRLVAHARVAEDLVVEGLELGIG